MFYYEPRLEWSTFCLRYNYLPISDRNSKYIYSNEIKYKMKEIQCYSYIKSRKLKFCSEALATCTQNEEAINTEDIKELHGHCFHFFWLAEPFLFNA